MSEKKNVEQPIEEEVTEEVLEEEVVAEEVATPPKEKLAEKEAKKPVSEPSKVDPEKVAVKVKEKSIEGDEGGIVTLSNGHRVRFVPVSYNVLFSAQAEIIDPPVPKVPHPEDPDSFPERYTFNTEHPDYLAALRINELKRTDAIQNSLYLFGLELVDPMPEDETWLEKLVLSGLVDKEEATDPSDLQKELWYKKYIVATVGALTKLSQMTEVSGEGIGRAAAAFKSNA